MSILYVYFKIWKRNQAKLQSQIIFFYEKSRNALKMANLISFQRDVHEKDLWIKHRQLT